MIPSRRLLSRLLPLILLGTLLGLQSPATAATTRTLSIGSNPTAAVVNTAVTISGVLSKSPKGSAVKVQRKVGTSWVTAASVKTRTTTGRYAARITLPGTVGSYSYRAVAPATRSLKAATSRTIKVFAGLPISATIKAAPSVVTAGTNAKLTGTVKPFVASTVVTFQKLIMGKWVSTGVTTKLTSKGTYSKLIRVTDSSYFRVSVPRAGKYAPGASGGAAVRANPAISSTSLPSGTRGTAYTAKLTQVGSYPGTWGVSPALPAGLSLNASTGVISGTPSVTVTDKSFLFSLAQPGLVTGTKTLKLTIAPPVPPTITNASLKDAKQGVGYTETLTAQGAPAGTWTASPLPAGLSLVGNTISGTPTAAGTTQVTIGFTQTNTGLSATPKVLDLTVIAPPTITTSSLTTGKQGTSYTETLAAQGAPAGTWTASPLPAGLSLVASTGVISGTPTVAGTTQVTIGFTQTSSGLSATPKVLDLTITPPQPVIETTELPNGSIGGSYEFFLQTVGGVSGTWSLQSGSLPPFYNLNTGTGRISGSTLFAGTYNFTVGFTNADGTATPVALSLTIA